VTYISGFVASVVLERGKFVFRKRDAFYAGSLMALAGGNLIKLFFSVFYEFS
jgi:hypothetical protein